MRTISRGELAKATWVRGRGRGKAWVRARLRRIWYVVRTGQGRGKRFEQRGLGARGGYGVISKGVE